MRKFKFRLQGLEDIKGMELDNLRQTHAIKQRKLLETETELLNVKESLNRTYNELVDLRMERVDPLILLSMESYTGVLREQINKLAKKIVEQRQELREARDKLAEKHKEKKVLEKYHEKKYSEYSQYVDRETQKELDETAQNMHSQADSD